MAADRSAPKLLPVQDWTRSPCPPCTHRAALRGYKTRQRKAPSVRRTWILSLWRTSDVSFGPDWWSAWRKYFPHTVCLCFCLRDFVCGQGSNQWRTAPRLCVESLGQSWPSTHSNSPQGDCASTFISLLTAHSPELMRRVPETMLNLDTLYPMPPPQTIVSATAVYWLIRGLPIPSFTHALNTWCHRCSPRNRFFEAASFQFADLKRGWALGSSRICAVIPAKRPEAPPATAAWNLQGIQICIHDSPWNYGNVLTTVSVK